MSKGKVVVIGGGVLGAACAMELAENGWQVTLLERAGIASAASGGNLGQLSLLDRTEPWHMQLTLESLEFYAKDGWRQQVEYLPNGGNILIEQPEELAKAEAIADRMAAYDIPCEILRGEACRKHAPGLDVRQVEGILHCSREGVLNPLKTTIAFWDAAARAGAQLREYCPVTGFRMQSDRIVAAQTPDGEVEGDLFINCAGAWAAEIGRMAGQEISLSWRRGAAMVTTPTDPVVYGQLCDHEMLTDTASALGKNQGQTIVVALSQTQNGNLLIAQATDCTDVNDKEVSLLGVCRVAHELIKRFPDCKGLEVLRIWAAVTPFSRDGNPFFGFGETAGNLFTAAGFKGAFSTAPAVAVRVRDALNGCVPDAFAAFAPDRKGAAQ